LFFFFFDPEQPKRAVFKVLLEGEFPVWSVTHYLQQLEANYRKMLLTDLVCQALASGVTDDKIFLASHSEHLYSEENASFEDYKEYKILGPKDASPKEFWIGLQSLKRPLVFIEGEEGPEPIYRLRGFEALKINELSVASEPAMTLIGVATALVKLFTNLDERERHQRLDDGRILVEDARLEYELVHLVDATENVNLSPGARAYADSARRNISNKQQALNTRFSASARVGRVDEEA